MDSFKEIYESVLKGKIFKQDVWDKKELKFISKEFPVEIRYEFVTYANEKQFNSSSWNSWRGQTKCSYSNLNKTIQWINKWHENWDKESKLGPYRGFDVLTIYGSEEEQGDIFYDIRLDIFEIKNRNKKELPKEFLDDIVNKLKKGLKK